MAIEISRSRALAAAVCSVLALSAVPRIVAAQNASEVATGALEGDYGGASAQITAGLGVGANALVGGFDRSIALQPVSVEGNTGLAAAAGVGVMTLRQG